MGSYETVISIVSFMIISSFVLIQGGGAEFLFDIPESEKPAVLFPQEAEPGFTTIDLEDEAVVAENITFVENTSNLSNPDAEFDTEKVAVLAGNNDSGRLVYNLPGVEALKTKSARCNIFDLDTRVEVDNDGSGASQIGICGESAFNVNGDNANNIVVEFQPPSGGGNTPRLYELSWSIREKNTGAFSGLIGYVDTVIDFITYPVRLWDYFEHFPFYIQLFYGALLAWMAIDIAQIG